MSRYPVILTMTGQKSQIFILDSMQESGWSSNQKGNS